MASIFDALVPIRFHHDLDAVVFLLLEGAVSRRRFVERQLVCEHKRGIYLSVLNEFQKGAQIFVNVRLTHLESETL